MRLVRYVVPALVAGLLYPLPVHGQQTLGTVTGKVVDGVTQQALVGVRVRLEGIRRETNSASDGTFILGDVPAGSYKVAATRIGFSPVVQDVTVAAGATANVQFTLQPSAAVLDPVVVTGYGTQRREAVTASVATIDPGTANVGVVPNVNQMLQGRAAGVNVVTNNGEPGAGAQIRIRGGTSIGASNEPLYVVDGVPITNTDVEPGGLTLGSSPSLPRSPLNLLNPNDVASITILKDASATAIYGSRGANGVVLIETKKGAAGPAGGTTIEYESYVASASPARRLHPLTGAEYRAFVRSEISRHYSADSVRHPLDSSFLSVLDTVYNANTDWERQITRTGTINNHNLAFAGGSDVTRYRASLNYMDQQGVALASGFQRIQGRLNGTHQALNSRLRLGVNVSTSRINDDYLSFENTGGFEGGVFVNMVSFNPTLPVIDSTGTNYYELGTGAQSIRNPVALANQIQDFGNATRTLGNASAELDLVAGLTASVNVGVDQSEGIRRTYFPNASPAGAQWSGRARQTNRENSSVTFQGQLSYRRQLADVHTFDVVGVYEFTESHFHEFFAESQGFVTDKFSFNSLNSGNTLVRPGSSANDGRWISFLSRANYGYKEKYYLTGVVRYDGRSAFAEGHQWAAFPGLSASWHLSEEDFMRSSPFSDLRLRLGWGTVGNPGVPPYASLLTLEATGSARYVFGSTPVVGFAPTRNPNPDLKFERTTAVNAALDIGLMQNRLSGTAEYYVKNTSDLLLEVDVPQPAPVTRRLQNIGKVRIRGFELTMDALPIARPGMTWRAGIVLSAERNKVITIGDTASLINSGFASGEGQSGQVSQVVKAGLPLGTFWGPTYAGVDTLGVQQFRCTVVNPACVSGITTNKSLADLGPIGNAYPDFTIGLHSELTWGKFDASILVRASLGAEVFNNTGLVYGTKTKVRQGRNFLATALDDPIAIGQPAIFSSHWIQDASYIRVQNLTAGYTFDLPRFSGVGRTARVYMSADNLLLLTQYSGLDPEVHAESGLASRGIDYLSYPRPRTFTAGVRVAF